MPMCNLLEYSENYRKTTGSLWNYYRDDPNSGYNNEDRDRIHYSIKDSETFNYTTSITGKLENNEDELENIKIVEALKYLSNFLKNLVPLINCELSLDLRWIRNCVLTSRAARNEIDAEGNLPAVVAINNPTNAIFEITDCKLNVPVVSLSIEDENILLNKVKDGVSRKTKWNKYRCQSYNQIANNNLN